MSHCPHCGVMNAHLDQHPNWQGGMMVYLGASPNQVAERRAMEGYAPGFEPPKDSSDS